MQELQDLHSSTEVQELGIRVAINEADITDVTAELDGPPGGQQLLCCVSHMHAAVDRQAST
jgi:hypothetical protein